MLVVRCPNCRADLDLDPEDVGHRVACPGCQTAFTAVRPPPPAPPPLPPEEVLLTAAEPPADVPPPLPDVPPPPPASPTESEPPPPPLPPPPPSPAPPRAIVRSSRPPADAPLNLECPACLGRVTVLPDDLGHKVECPICHEAFRAEDPSRPGDRSSRRDEPSRRTSRRRDSRYDDDWDDRPRRRDRGWDDHVADPRELMWRAERGLAGPGGALEILGYLDIVFGILSLLIGLGWGLAAANGGGSTASLWQLVWMNAGPGLTGLVLGAVKVVGGRAMKRVKNRSLALTACFGSFTPLNIAFCLGVFMFPAYVVGVVFGILGLTQLFKKDVRKAFEANRPDGDADTV